MQENIDSKQYIFASIFILANRLQTACEKIQKDITMKQWLMLALISKTNSKQNLSDIGKIMGCSRQNVKKLARPLQEKGYIEFVKGNNNSLNIITTDKFDQYSKSMANRHSKSLELLFDEFSNEDLANLAKYFDKFFLTIENVEAYGEEINERQ